MHTDAKRHDVRLLSAAGVPRKRIAEVLGGVDPYDPKDGPGSRQYRRGCGRAASTPKPGRWGSGRPSVIDEVRAIRWQSGSPGRRR